MKKSVAMRWVKALRSGKYKQGEGKLKTDDGAYCCLGVLCEIENLKENIENSVLGLKSMAATGMKISNGTLVVGNGLITNLTVLNDYGNLYLPKLIFNEIADIIQVCWEEL